MASLVRVTHGNYSSSEVASSEQTSPECIITQVLHDLINSYRNNIILAPQSQFVAHTSTVLHGNSQDWGPERKTFSASALTLDSGEAAIKMATIRVTYNFPLQITTSNLHHYCLFEANLSDVLVN